MVVAGVCPCLRVPCCGATGRAQFRTSIQKITEVFSSKHHYEVKITDKNIFPGKVAEKTELVMQNLKWRGCVICTAH